MPALFEPQLVHLAYKACMNSEHLSGIAKFVGRAFVAVGICLRSYQALSRWSRKTAASRSHGQLECS
jgi:hypothetical protein